MTATLMAAVAAAVGDGVVALTAIAGGDINRAFRADLTSGRSVFVKHHAAPPPGMFDAEADGLRWLAEAQAIRVPAVLAVADTPPAFLALEWIEQGRPDPRHDEQLGRRLAALHRFGAPCFGRERDNYVATVPMDNTPSRDWPAFFRHRRLAPLIRTCRERGMLGDAEATRFERLLDRLPLVCGPPEEPARLHGDLWSGNAIVDTSGEPVLVDPAAFGGHREVDLAMMRLFGGFSERVFAAYDEAFPLAPDHGERVALYQLWPLLVHAVLFGGGYLDRAVRQCRGYL